MLALCTMVTFLRPVADRVREGEFEQPPAALTRVHPRRHGDRMGIVVDLNVMFVAYVEALEILANHHEIDVVEAAARNQRACRTQIGIQLEFLP